MFAKATGKTVKCRTCKESFQLAAEVSDAVRTSPTDVPPLENEVNKDVPRLYQFPDRTRAVQLVSRMWHRMFLTPGLALIVMTVGCIRFANANLSEDHDKAGRIFMIGIGILIASRFINERLRRHRETLEIQMNIERLLVTIANNTTPR